jgi:hypothetical protein
MINVRLSTLAAACGLLSSVCLAQNARQAAIGPFEFENGNRTSRTMVFDTIRHILEHHGFNVVAQDMSDRSYQGMNPPIAFRRGRPEPGDLLRFANSVGAHLVVCGRAKWDTRSIWVGTGPKTISTATVDVFVYNVRTGSLVLETRGIEGRSDERESALKDVADVLITPLVTVVSGGPATPREQRAVQIALGRAIRPWAIRHDR